MLGFPGGSEGEESACNVGDWGLREAPLEKGMATHSSILIWRTPWTEELGGSHGHDRVTSTLTISCYRICKYIF